MPVRMSEAVWMGGLLDGRGTIRLGSGSFAGDYSFPSRFEGGHGTNPEELMAAAHAGCCSMALAADLGQSGHEATSIRTVARVQFGSEDGTYRIKGIELETQALVPQMSEVEFQERAQAIADSCMVSLALSCVSITLTAKLISS